MGEERSSGICDEGVGEGGAGAAQHHKMHDPDQT